MATNDGYAPYPLNLTALQAKDAITRSHNLSTELAGYVANNYSATVPLTPKDGDTWRNSVTGVYFTANVDSSTDPLNPVTIFFEA